MKKIEGLKIEGLLQQLTSTSNKTEIEEIAKQLGGIDNLITGEVLRNILNTHFQNTILTNAVAELEKLITQKSSDKQKYNTVLGNIVRGAAPSSGESKSEEPAFIDINENNQIWVLKLVTLLKGLYQRSLYNSQQWGAAAKDIPIKSSAGRTRLEIAKNFETAANTLLTRLTPAPALAPATNTVTGTQEEKTTEEHPVTNLLADMEQRIVKLKTKITANEQRLDVKDLLEDTVTLNKELDELCLEFRDQNTKATSKCKKYEDTLEKLSDGEIPADLLETVKADEKLQPLVHAYQSGRAGSYFSPTAWSNWYSLDATKKNLNEALQISFQSKVSSAQNEIKESAEAIKDCGSLIRTTASLRDTLTLTMKLERCQTFASQTEYCIKCLEADIAKLNSGWVKVKYFLTRKSAERKNKIAVKTRDISKLRVQKNGLMADLKILSSCKDSLFNSANSQVLKKSANEPAQQSARPAA